MYIANMNYKTCTKCRECKPEHRFYYIKRKEGYDSRCKHCIYRYQQARKKKLKALGITAKPQKGIPYEAKAERAKKAITKAVKKWRDNNRERFNHEQKLSIRLRRSQAYKDHWLAIVAHYGNRCLCCRATDKQLCFDHVIPISQNGANDATNGQPLCRRCNTYKGQAEPTKDYRPDKGQYACALLGITWTNERKGLFLAMNDDMGNGGNKNEGIGFPVPAKLTQEQLARKRIIDGILANVPGTPLD